MPRPDDKPLTQKTDSQFEHVSKGATVVIGAFASAAFRHGMRASKWGGRHWFDLQAIGVEDSENPKLKPHSNADAVEVTASWRKGGKKKTRLDRWYAGSTEWEIEYSELPEQAIQFEIALSPGTMAHWQAPLSDEDIADGSGRPENVVDSFAIYASVSNRLTRPDGAEIENYETGKLAHLYRPRWIAADDSWAWAVHSISDGVWSVFPPSSEWSLSHAGPWRLDPTIGYDSIGGSTNGEGGDSLRGYGPFALSEAGDASSVSCYAGSTIPASLTLGIYNDSSTYPGTLQRDTAGGGVTPSAWNTQDLDSSVSLSVGDYWIIQNHKNATFLMHYDSVSGFSRYAYTSAYSEGTLPTPYAAGATQTANRKYSLYATYTPSASVSRFPWQQRRHRRMAGAR